MTPARQHTEPPQGFEPLSPAASAFSPREAGLSTSMDPGYPSVTQFQALNRLLQRRSFGEELCQIGHNAYQTQIAHEAATTLFTPGMSEPDRERLFATSIAPLYAIDSLITSKWLHHKTSPLAALDEIIEDASASQGVTDLGLLANATWKAGQPFRGLGRIERPVFRSLVTLGQEELSKDPILVKAMAIRLREALQEELEIAYKPELKRHYFEQIDHLIERFDQRCQAKGVQHSAEQLHALRKTARDCMYCHAGQTRINGDPYFDHLLAVADGVSEIFGVTDIRVLHLAFKHDLREDQATDYELRKLYRLNKIARNAGLATRTEEERIELAEKTEEFRLERLGIRWLSKLKDGDPQLSKSKFSKDPRVVTYEQLARPRDFYEGEYPESWISAMQILKLTDILKNTATVGAALEPTPTFSPSTSDLNFPHEFVTKVLNYAIPYFVQHSEILPPTTRRTFYEELDRTLRRYCEPAFTQRSEAHSSFAEALQRSGGYLEQLETLNVH